MRARLRAATDDVHQALHHAAPFAAIAEGRATPEAYGAVLRFLHRYHAGMTQSCARGAAALSMPHLGDVHAARVAALAGDLADMGMEPGFAPLPELHDDDFCIGILYTVQGSTLGGRVIYRQLDSLLPDAAGRRFFRGFPDDGRDWQALCAALDSCRAAPAALEAGAKHAFARFAAMLETGAG